LEELRGPDPKARKKAVVALAHAAPAAPEALAAVIQCVQDHDAAVRREAVLGLLNLGPAAREAVPALTEAARADADQTVRSYAAKALARIQGDGDANEEVDVK
jgi:HEAT repeat protein